MTEPSDLPADDAVELASRYVDGDLDAGERAAAEADSEVMAWVERFAGIRSALAEPVEVDAPARDAAIAAALSVFDEQETSPAVGAPAVTELAAARARRVRRTSRWLGAAAAAAAVAVGGAVLSANRGGNDDLSSADTTVVMFNEQAEKVAETPAPEERVLTMAADTTIDDGATARDATAGESDAPWDMTSGATDAPAATTAASAETTAAGTGTTGAGGDAPERSADSGDTVLQEPEDLLTLVAAPLAPIPPTEAPCDTATGDFVDTALYQDAPAAIYRDDAARVITAYDAASCVVLATIGFG